LERIEFREKETKSLRRYVGGRSVSRDAKRTASAHASNWTNCGWKKSASWWNLSHCALNFREREAKGSEEICRWKEEFKRCEEEIRIDLKETCIILEKEREKSSCSTKSIHELREQIEVLKRSWKSANESEEKAYEELEKARKETRKADHERDECQAKLFEAEETICKLREEGNNERDSECRKELIKC